MKSLSFIAAFILMFLTMGKGIDAQSLSIVSGNGQVVQENFATQAPLKVQAKDSAGRPAAGVSVNWSVTQGFGTLPNPMTMTDADGFASASFVGPNLQPGTSFLAATITVTSASTAVNFVVTTAALRQSGGGQAAPPLVELITPRNVMGPAGSTVAGAVMLRVTAQSGLQLGQGVPNVGVQIVNDTTDPSVPSAICNGPAGVVLTDSHGVATCDLVLGRQTGTTTIAVNIGGSLNQQTLTLQVTPGVACSYILSATTQTFSATGGMGTLSVTTPTGCAWTAVSNASWITINFGANNSTNANVGYMVAPDTGAARSSTLVIAGQTYTVNQSGTVGGGGGALMIVTGSNLPPATVGIPYAATFAATGGQLPYVWSASGTLPPGFSLNSNTGTLTSTPSGVGNYTLAATVTDALGRTQTQAFSLGVLSSSSSLAITTAGLPSGAIGQPYQQPLTSSGGCITPFAPVPVFSITGGTLPAGLTLQQSVGGGFSIAGTPTAAGISNFTLAVKDACGSQVNAPFSLTILATAGPTMVVAPIALAFNVQIGSPSLPGDQALTITSNGVAVPYSATVSTTTGGNWLALPNPVGATPGNLTVSVVNYGQLPVGTYSGAVAITSGASNSPVLIPVTLTITGPPILMVSPSKVAFTQGGLGATVTQQAIVIGSGGPPVHFTAVANTINGGPWLFLDKSSGDTPATLLASVNSAGLTPGSYSGTIVISVPGTGSQAVLVSLTVPALGALSVSPASLSFSAPRGVAAVPSQSLTLIAGASPFTAAPYTATVFTANGSGWLTVVPQIGFTPANISVLVNPADLPFGSYSGTITIVSSDLTLMPVSVPVSLTVGQAAPVLRAITNAASFAPGPIAPGEIVTIFGSGLGPAALAAGQLDANGNVANLDVGTQVLFDGIAAPIVYTSDTQIAAIVPYEVFGRDTVEVHVSYFSSFTNLSVVSNSINMRIADSSPAIFTQNAMGQGAILNQDGSVNFPQTGAAPGSYVSVFATGEGQTNPPGVNGKIVAPDVLPRPRLLVTVLVAGQQADVTYAGGAPGLAAGIMQVNVHLPDNLPHGVQVPVVLTVGNQTSPTVFLSVK
ncbi:MAG: putative Ig domain-containing protein [Acidobacteriota bacterium]|nr:putative Ig domain-containing protein [Acidobacteriota bacterium]